MYLLSFRVIGHPAMPDAPWVKVGRGLNILKTARHDQAKALLQMLQTVNPPYDISLIDPFRDLPRYISGPTYTRKIIPFKKSAALAIFAASPPLVRQLAAIDPVLYETDRIEFGRRRDRSRWVNFVELSGSTRWSEIAAVLGTLLSRLGPDEAAAGEQLRAAMTPLRGTDRLKGETAMALKKALEALRPSLAESEQAGIDNCLWAVDRDLRFRMAKDTVCGRLPLFLSIPEAAMGCSADQAAACSPADASIALFADLGQRLRQGQGDQAPVARRLDQVNRRLQSLHPELSLSFKDKGDAIVLESAQGGASLPFTELGPVESIEAQLAALAGLHEELYGCQPIFLLDINALRLEGAQRADLLQILLRHASRWQCLVIPDSAFLALYREAIGEGSEEESLSILIDLEAV